MGEYDLTTTPSVDCGTYIASAAECTVIGFVQCKSDVSKDIAHLVGTTMRCVKTWVLDAGAGAGNTSACPDGTSLRA